MIGQTISEKDDNADYVIGLIDGENYLPYLPTKKGDYPRRYGIPDNAKGLEYLDGDMNNNKMERSNGEVRDMEKVMRGLKNTNTPILPRYQIFHNYMRPHQSLKGKTPAEACGIKIEGDNKWITLIQNASQQNEGKTKDLNE